MENVYWSRLLITVLVVFTYFILSLINFIELLHIVDVVKLNFTILSCSLQENVLKNNSRNICHFHKFADNLNGYLYLSGRLASLTRQTNRGCSGRCLPKKFHTAMYDNYMVSAFHLNPDSSTVTSRIK